MTRTATTAQAKLTAFIGRLTEDQQLDAYAAIVDGYTANPLAQQLVAGADEATRRIVTNYLRRAIRTWREADLESVPVRAVLDAAERAEGTEAVGAIENLDRIIRDEWLEAQFPEALDAALEATEGDEDNMELYRATFLRAARVQLG